MYREYCKLFFCKHSNVMNGIFFLTLELMTKIQAWDTKRYPILINLKRTANNGTHLPDVIKWWLNPFLLNNLHKPFHLVAQAGMGKVEGNRNKIAGVVGKDCYFFPAFPNANLGRRDSWRGACKKKKRKLVFYVQPFATSWTGLSPRVCSNSCPLNWWCHPTLSSSVTHFSCPQSFPAPGLFQRVDSSHLWPKYCSFSISPSKEYSEWISFRIDWSSCFQRTLRVFSRTTIWKHQFFGT